MLAVRKRMLSIGDVQNVRSVIIVLTGAVDLKLDTKIAIAVAIENGRRLVVS